MSNGGHDVEVANVYISIGKSDNKIERWTPSGTVLQQTMVCDGSVSTTTKFSYSAVTHNGKPRVILSFANSAHRIFDYVGP